MTLTILRRPLPAPANRHDIDLPIGSVIASALAERSPPRTRIFGKSGHADLVVLFAVGDPQKRVEKRRFGIMRPGDPLPDFWTYVAAVTLPTSGEIVHVIEADIKALSPYHVRYQAAGPSTPAEPLDDLDPLDDF